MQKTVTQEVVRKVRKLAQLSQEARRSRFAVDITRLTILKSLCRQPEVANRFVTFLAQRTQQKVASSTRRPGHLSMHEWERCRELIDRAVSALIDRLRRRSAKAQLRLSSLFQELTNEQNEHRRVYGHPVRVIKDNDLLLVEYAVCTILSDAASAPLWAYQTARVYAECYASNRGTGLTPASAPLLQDITDFWIQELGLSLESINTPAKTRTPKQTKPPVRPSKQNVRFTRKQGQFLAFIHQYRKLHRQGPAEQDMVQYFCVTPPSVHSMVVRLEHLGLVTREQGVARSVRVAIPEEAIPALE